MVNKHIHKSVLVVIGNSFRYFCVLYCIYEYRAPRVSDVTKDIIATILTGGVRIQLRL